MDKLKSVFWFIIPFVFWGTLLNILPGSDILLFVFVIPITILGAFLFFSLIGLLILSIWDWLVKYGYLSRTPVPNRWYGDDWTEHIRYASIGFLSFVICGAIIVVTRL